MKSLIITALLITSGFAMADRFPGFAESGLSQACENRVMTAVQKKCNADSLAAEGKDRMNPCQDFQSDIATQGDATGKLEAGGYAGDADGYWYTIDILNAEACKFSLKAQQ